MTPHIIPSATAHKIANALHIHSAHQAEEALSMCGGDCECAYEVCRILVDATEEMARRTMFQPSDFGLKDPYGYGVARVKIAFKIAQERGLI